MTSNRQEWVLTKNRLVEAVQKLGFPKELGEAVAKNLGSPKAMERMIVYLREVKPKKAEFVVDEMLAICSEIEAWRERKTSLEASARFNEMMAEGFGDETDD